MIFFTIPKIHSYVFYCHKIQFRYVFYNLFSFHGLIRFCHCKNGLIRFCHCIKHVLCWTYPVLSLYKIRPRWTYPVSSLWNTHKLRLSYDKYFNVLPPQYFFTYKNAEIIICWVCTKLEYLQ